MDEKQAAELYHELSWALDQVDTIGGALSNARKLGGAAFKERVTAGLKAQSELWNALRDLQGMYPVFDDVPSADDNQAGLLPGPQSLIPVDFDVRTTGGSS